MVPELMVPELGHFALMLALCFSAALFVLPMLGAHYGNQLLMHTGRSLSAGFFIFVALAFVCLSYAFAHDDFSVKYVASNSNSLLPYYYKLLHSFPIRRSSDYDVRSHSIKQFLMVPLLDIPSPWVQ